MKNEGEGFSITIPKLGADRFCVTSGYGSECRIIKIDCTYSETKKIFLLYFTFYPQLLEKEFNVSLFS